MSYITKEIKQGIKLHLIETDKFKTNLMGIFLTIPLKKENVTLDAVIPAVLKRGTGNLKTQEDISKKLEDMYGAILDCGIEKSGDNHIIKFYIESLNNKFIPKNSNQNVDKESIDLLLDVIFNPLIENESLKKEYVDSEKNNVKLLIESKIDNKDAYAFNRCIEEMYKDKPYGLYKFGYTEDLEKINEQILYNYYLDLINTAKIDIIISGDLNKDEIINLVEKNENIQKLNERKAQNIINNEETEIKDKVEIRKIEESMNITQGKLVIGLDINYNEPNSRFAMCLYNVILRRKCYIKIVSKCKGKSKFSIYCKVKLYKTKK